MQEAVEIDPAAIEHNYACIRRHFPGKKILSVLKADAYGHGIRGIVPVCERQTIHEFSGLYTFLNRMTAYPRCGKRGPRREARKV